MIQSINSMPHVRNHYSRLLCHFVKINASFEGGRGGEREGGREEGGGRESIMRWVHMAWSGCIG